MLTASESGELNMKNNAVDDSEDDSQRFPLHFAEAETAGVNFLVSFNFAVKMNIDPESESGGQVPKVFRCCR